MDALNTKFKHQEEPMTSNKFRLRPPISKFEALDKVKKEELQQMMMIMTRSHSTTFWET